jgi:polyketide cyclase/dehydrase/lipid transport protein
VPRIFYGSIIPSSIDRVWAVIRDFNKFPSWYPEVCDSSIEGSRPSDAVGCVRSLYLKRGGHFRERLLTLSDREYMFTYTILESPLPMTDYVSSSSCGP